MKQLWRPLAAIFLLSIAGLAHAVPSSYPVGTTYYDPHKA